MSRSVSLARKIVRKWQETGIEPAGDLTVGHQGSSTSPLLPLDYAFQLILNQAHARGLYEGIRLVDKSFRLMEVKTPVHLVGEKDNLQPTWISDLITEVEEKATLTGSFHLCHSQEGGNNEPEAFQDKLVAGHALPQSCASRSRSSHDPLRLRI